MLGGLANDNLLVHTKYTSENGCPLQLNWGRDNQQERLVFKMSIKVSDDYLIGFVEGEGMFYIGIVPSKETKTGWQVIYFLKVSQNPSGKVILDYFLKRLGCGYLKANSLKDPTDKSLAYVVRDLKSLKDKVIPFFENKLIIKRNSFESFKKVIEIVSRKEHLSLKGITEVLDIAYLMNTQKRRVTKEQILKSYQN